MRLGVLGGTFDPVHFGHLETASELCERLSLDRLDLMPCQVHALQKKPSASTAQRLAMLEMAVADYAGLAIDRREVEREGVSYTVDSLSAIRSELGCDAALYFIVGADAFVALEQWHRWREMFEYASMVVVQRPGSPLAETVDSPVLQSLLQKRGIAIERIGPYTAGKIAIVQLTPHDLASSSIRKCCTIEHAAGTYLLEQVPAAVADYIEAHQLYR